MLHRNLHDRVGSFPGITAPQQQWPLHLNQQTYSARLAPPSCRHGPALSMARPSHARSMASPIRAVTVRAPGRKRVACVFDLIAGRQLRREPSESNPRTCRARPHMGGQLAPPLRATPSIAKAGLSIARERRLPKSVACDDRPTFQANFSCIFNSLVLTKSLNSKRISV